MERATLERPGLSAAALLPGECVTPWLRLLARRMAHRRIERWLERRAPVEEILEHGVRITRHPPLPFRR